MIDLNRMKVALEGATAAPFALYGWRQTPDAPAWGVVTQTGEAGAIWSDDQQEAQALRGYVSLFCRQLGSLKDTVQGVLNALGVCWRFEAEDYEDDKQLLHYTWRWEEWGD